MSDKDKIFEIFLREYDKLKSEQAQRIGFRDNLLYVTLGLFATIVSFALTNPSNYYGLLIIPWVSLILGWTYVVNDEKITAIGKYIRHDLINKLKEYIEYNNLELLLSWEVSHRNDSNRKRRKIEQLIIDQITFIVSGMVALSAFWFLVPNSPCFIRFLSIIELLFLIILGIEIFIYADLKQGS